MSVAKEFPLLAQVYIASPCSADWEQMTGDDRARFCGACQKHVYNISEMTAPAAEALIREREGNFCGRIYRRADGTILTADCPVGIAAVQARLRRAMYGALALAVSCCLGALQVSGMNRFLAGNQVGTLRLLYDRLTQPPRSGRLVRATTMVSGIVCVPELATPFYRPSKVEDETEEGSAEQELSPPTPPTEVLKSEQSP